MEKIFAYPAFVPAMCETDMEGGNCCHESVRIVCGSGGEPCKSGGKRSHVCMIPPSWILFFSLTQDRSMRKTKFYFILRLIQMLEFILATGVRNRTTDIVT